MNTFLSTKPQEKIKPSQILGGIIGGFEDNNYERESFSASFVSKGIRDLTEAIIDLGKQTVETDKKSAKNIPPTGTIEFTKYQAQVEEDKQKQEKATQDRMFFQTLKDDQLRTQIAKDAMWMEEEINDVSANISTEERNELLHLQADYKNSGSIYHRAELRKKIIEARKKSENNNKESSIPSPAKQPSALEGAFEGTAGSVGSGTANFGKGSVQ